MAEAATVTPAARSSPSRAESQELLDEMQLQIGEHLWKLQGDVDIEGQRMAPSPPKSFSVITEQPCTSQEDTVTLNMSQIIDHGDNEESTQEVYTPPETRSEPVVPGKKRRLQQSALERVVQAMNAPMAVPTELLPENEDPYTGIFKNFAGVFKDESPETKGRIVARVWNVIQEEMAHGSNQ